MAKSLVIVESPAKAKTINKFLGKDFVVKASVGHIKDLPENKLGVDIDAGFEPQYVVIKGKRKVINELKKAGKGARDIYLAPDPDREGEAIAWHIAEELGSDGKKIYRVLVYEITPQGVKDALAHPQALQEHRYQAQQARRILDRLVGYKISPLLWKKVRRGLSAGRVQSVALRLICEREREIKAFVPQEYWSITAHLEKGESPPPFKARLTKVQGRKVTIPDEANAASLVSRLKNRPFIVEDVDRKEKRRHPAPPFITSTLQQEASRKLRFTAKKTMRTAQQLYEGIDLGDAGMVGLITYMRTDSVRLSPAAVAAARDLIGRLYGDTYVPSKPNFFKSRRGAQEAHEAIRPTSLNLLPENVKAHLTRDQFALYQLIWARFLACQMKPAVYDHTTISIAADGHTFTATGSVMKFPGFTAVYIEGSDEQNGGNDIEALPSVQKGDVLTLLDLVPKQHFTQPPLRYSESTLVKELEDKGIGRPSTYAAILSTIQEKRYVKLVERKFEPTDLGMLLSDLLAENFPTIMDVGFTAQMEENLDKIERRAVSWQKVLKEFYDRFQENLKVAGEQMRDVKKERIPTNILCEQCGSPMEIRWGRFGEFLACSAYPKCRHTRPFMRGPQGEIVVASAQPTDDVCPICGGPMVVRQGKYGSFLACSRYPECKGTKREVTGVSCPQEGCTGELIQRRTKRGRIFYGCTKYPTCRYAIWDPPVPTPCPVCAASFILEKRTKKGAKLVCSKKGCPYETVVTEDGGASSSDDV